jgi:hypothetical protein
MLLTYDSGTCPSYLEPAPEAGGQVELVPDLQAGTLEFTDSAFCSTVGSDDISASCVVDVADNACFGNVGKLPNGDAYQAEGTMSWELHFSGSTVTGTATASLTNTDTTTSTATPCTMTFAVTGGACDGGTCPCEPNGSFNSAQCGASGCRTDCCSGSFYSGNDGLQNVCN